MSDESDGSDVGDEAAASPEIRELDATTIERIAAGEVVERPASVVKELVENAIDADASRVRVSVENGGIDGIRVEDDGHGMAEAAARRAVEKHTTSKIRDIEDLEAGVSTLGFRGEALYAIGAVSRLTVTTRPRSGGRGTEVRVEGGETAHVGPAGCPTGTTVAVDDLFYNVPARRKYLKQPTTEVDNVQRVVTGYALANPDVAVTFETDGRERFATTGRGDLRSAVMAVYGREVASAMVPIEANAPDGPLSGVSGLVSHPETTRASSEYVATFVNGRWVTARAVREAVVDAYGGQLAPDRYPFAVVFLDIDPAETDVNVHPRKLEVRFADEAGVREQVETSVERALLDAGLIRSRAPRGRSAPEQTEISPERTTEARDESSATPETESERTGVGAGDDQRAGDRSADDRSSSDAATGDGATSCPSRARRPRTGADPRDVPETPTTRSRPGRRRPAASRTSASAGESNGTTDEGTSRATAPDDSGVTEREDGPSTTGGDDTPSRTPFVSGGDRSTEAPSTADRKFRGPVEQTRLSERPPEAEYERLPTLRVLGQYDETYLVAEADDGLLLVDQHAADERINYERLREQFAAGVTAQTLAEPVDLELTAREATLFDSYREALAELGFDATLADDRTVRVESVPALLTGHEDLVRDLLTAFVAGDGAATVSEAADELLADLACYPSIKGNTSLREGTVVDLLSALDDCENPYACPHGRPTIVAFDRGDIEDRFERDYPGHGGRRDDL
ncbi:DNA mismatch repair endonuclease MutL [Halomarina rubra]|uniref:DNA mismatch repair protein MutL n=1 Tax=Halomarina rubra TaxID=2071873 RepID=A0ABD6ATM6_9EURY|nr:DNA mismatch repair endonuclease MutL [Halomarina rubra]